MLSGLDEIRRSGLRVTRLLVMHRDDGGELALPIGIRREERLRGEAVQRAPVLFEKRGIRGVLHERMSEEVLQLRLEHRELNEAARFEGPELRAGLHAVFVSKRRSRMRTPNCRPITEATRSVRFVSGASRSIRASSRP